MTKKVAYISNEKQFHNLFLPFTHTNKSLLPANSILCRSPMAYNPPVSLNKLTCAEHVDFGKGQDSFERFSWTKNDSNYLDFKQKVFKREDKNAEF